MTAPHLAPLPRQRPPITLWISAGLLAGFALVALLAPWIVPYDPTDFVFDQAFHPATVAHPLGGDYLGRDLASRLIAGATLTLLMGISATLIAHLLGDMLGLLVAIRGGVLDMVLSRVVDVALSLPKIIVGLVVVAALGSSIQTLVIVTGLIYSASVFRVARALGRDTVNQDFVQIARLRGEGMGWLLFGEILPHVMRPLAADFALRMSFAILFMSSLSFLGLGVQPPLADWGALVRENLQGLGGGSLASIYPAAAIAIVSIALNLLVDALGERGEKAGLS